MLVSHQLAAPLCSTFYDPSLLYKKLDQPSLETRSGRKLRSRQVGLLMKLFQKEIEVYAELDEVRQGMSGVSCARRFCELTGYSYSWAVKYFSAYERLAMTIGQLSHEKIMFNGRYALSFRLELQSYVFQFLPRIVFPGSH